MVIWLKFFLIKISIFREKNLHREWQGVIWIEAPSSIDERTNEFWESILHPIHREILIYGISVTKPTASCVRVIHLNIKKMVMTLVGIMKYSPLRLKPAMCVVYLVLKLWQ